MLFLHRDVDLDAIPAEPPDPEPTVFMEDTVWPCEGVLEGSARGSPWS